MKKQILSVFFTLFVCCFNQLTWAEEVHELLVKGAINSEYFTATGASVVSETYVVGGVTYTQCVQMAGTASTPSGVNNPNKVIQYDARTTNTEVEFVVVNKSTGTGATSGNARKFYYTVIENGETTCSPEVFALDKNKESLTTISETRTSSSITNRSIYFSVDDKDDVRILAIKITEKGTPLPMAGEAGYAISFANARLIAAANADAFLDGTKLNMNESYTALICSRTYVPVRNATQYIKFYAPQNVKLTITIDATQDEAADGNNGYNFYVAQSLTAGTNLINAKRNGSYEYILSSGDWYIYSSGRTIKINALAFSALDIVPPTDINISTMGRVSFTEVDNAISYEARVYDGTELVYTQIVANGDMLNFVSKKESYNVRLVSNKDTYSSLESETYVWNSGVDHVYGVSNYVVSNQKTSQNEGGDADVFFTWETLKNGDVQIVMTNAQGKVDADYHFRGGAMTAAKFTLNGSAEEFAEVFECIHTPLSAVYTLRLKDAAPELGSVIAYSGDHVTYSVPGATNAWPNIVFSYIYGTPRYPIEHINPVIASFTGENNDYTTAELTIEASDLDDDNLPQTVLTYTLSADNGFETTQVVPDAQGKVLLEGLKKNAIYRFHMVVSDPNGNSAEADTEIKMLYDPAVNLALSKPITAGAYNDPIANANDGKVSTHWGTYGCGGKDGMTWEKANVLTIDLGETYAINRIVVMTGSMSGQSQTAIIEGSSDNSKWTEIVPSQTYAPEKYKESEDVDNSYIFPNLVASIRYIRIRATQDRMFAIKELEVYGTGYAAEDTTDPTIDEFSEVSSTVSSTTLKIIASDLDDNGGVGSISSIKISDVDNDFAEREILNDLVDNQITLTDLHFNTTYNFKVVVMDAASNTTESLLKVVLPFNTNLNLALAGTASAGDAENAKPASKANDGNDSSEWGTYGVSDYATANIWTLDLQTAYDVNRVVMKVGSMQGGNRNFAIQYSLDNEHWFVLVPSTKYQDEYVLDREVAVTARYFRVDASDNTNYVTLREFEVYGTAFATPDTEAPVLTGAEARDITPTTAVLDVTATDNVGIMRCHVWDSENGYDAEFVVQDNTVQLTDLQMGKITYNLKMTVFDLYNNESNIIDVSPFRTKADPSIPQIAILSVTTDKVLCPIAETVVLTPIVKDQFDADFTSVTIEYTVDAEQGSMTGNIFTPNDAFHGVATIHVLATSTTDAEEYREIDVNVYVNNHQSSILYQQSDAIIAVNEGAVGATNTAVLTNGNLNDAIAWQGSNQGNGAWKIDETTTTREFICWFVADLKEIYDIEAVALYFEGASSTRYKVYFSATGEDGDWQPAYQYAIEGKDNYQHNDVFFAGVNANNCSDIQASPAIAQNIRYVKFESTYGSTWGVKVNEIEVYGVHSPDAEKPVVNAVTLISHDDIHATIQIDATDNLGVVAYHVVDAAHGLDLNVEQTSGTIALSGLQHSTTYNLVVYALDRQGNVSDPFYMEPFTTDVNTSIPMVAAPIPVHGQADVTAIYSDKFTLAMTNTTNWAQWINGTIQSMGEINGNHYVYYDAMASTNNQIGIGTDWKAKDEYRFDPTDATKTGINITNRTYLHIDIWCSTNGELNITLNDAKLTEPTPLQLSAQQWVSFDLDISAINEETLQNLRWMKFTKMDGLVFAVDNIYFWSMPDPITIYQDEDNSTVLAEYDGRFVDVTLNRTFIADGANYTLCLPFDMTEEQCLEAFGEGYKLWEMGEAYKKSADMIYLPFSEVTSIEAGKPYLFCPAVDIENPIIVEEVTIDAETSTTIGNEYATMTGIYSPTEVDASNYVLGDDNWLYQSDGTQMKGLRCYFTLTPPSAPAGVRARAVFHNSDVTTDLEPIHRFTDSPIKVIKDGHLYIIRNGKQYNALGF